MMRFNAFLIFLIIILSAWSGAAAKETLKPGDTCRIKMLGSRETYVISRVYPDSLYLVGKKDNVMIQVPFSQMMTFDLRVQRSRGWGALRGGMVGALVGGIGGMVIALATNEDEIDDVNCGPLTTPCENTAKALRTVGMIGLVGGSCMVLGAIVGSMAPGYRWERIDVRRNIRRTSSDDRTRVILFSQKF